MKRLVSSATIVRVTVLVGCMGMTNAAAAQETSGSQAGHVLLNASEIT